jgi:hypothetical protein
VRVITTQLTADLWNAALLAAASVRRNEALALRAGTVRINGSGTSGRRNRARSVAVMINNLLRQFLQGQDIYGVVSGASLSFEEFQSAPAWIEVPGANEPDVNVVMIIGPDLISGALNLVQNLQQGYSKNISPNLNPKAYKNLNDVKNGLSQISNYITQAAAQTKGFIHAETTLVYQSPDTVLNGCIFSSDPSCLELVYSNGFQPVYTYAPPPGFNPSEACRSS